MPDMDNRHFVSRCPLRLPSKETPGNPADATFAANPQCPVGRAAIADFCAPEFLQDFPDQLSPRLKKPEMRRSSRKPTFP